MSDFAFPPETVAFLAGIAEHNDKEWFTAHRALYDVGYVEAAKSFVEIVGPELVAISPTVQFEPRIGASLMRVNRDTRFSRDKRPYKDHLDLWFWHGEKKSFSAPGFFMRLTHEWVWIGAGMHHFEPEPLARFRDAVIDDRDGAELLSAIAEVQGAGDYMVGSMPRKQVPRGYDKTHPRANLLLFEGFPAMGQLPIADALAPGFADRALGHFRNTWPVARWLLRHVAD